MLAWVVGSGDSYRRDGPNRVAISKSLIYSDVVRAHLHIAYPNVAYLSSDSSPDDWALHLQQEQGSMVRIFNLDVLFRKGLISRGNRSQSVSGLGGQAGRQAASLSDSRPVSK